jgi:hypothetical protein
MIWHQNSKTASLIPRNGSYYCVLSSADRAGATLVLWLGLEIAIYLAIPCLTFVAYRGWAKRGRQVLPSWRRYLGVGSMALTCIVWLGSAYLGFSLLAHLPTDFFTDTWMVANMFISVLAALGSLALEGRSRVCAFAAAVLMAAPFIFDYARGT